MSRARSLLAIVILLAAITPLYAQKPAAMELGFKPDRVYDFGSVDNVNALNGNLIVTIPIGRAYPVATGFQYGLTLLYNGSVWDYYDTFDDFGNPKKWAKPNLRSNAGPGWRVSLGRLLPPTDATLVGYNDEPQEWVYEGPSGDEHKFESNAYNGSATLDPDATVQFSVDGTFLRLIVVDTATRRVEFPDGKAHTFTYDHGAWRLKQMDDRGGNSVSVVYSYQSSTNRVVQYTISDSTGRSQIVNFTYSSSMNDTVDIGANVSSIKLNGSGTSSVTYTFNYTNTNVDYGYYHTYAGLTGNPLGTSIQLPLLTSITLPDSTSYAFDYFTSANSTGSQGLLKSVTLPSLGKLEYTYQLESLPPMSACAQVDPTNSAPGVRTRTVDGHTWNYLLTRGPDADIYYPGGPQNCSDPGAPGEHLPPNIPTRWVRRSLVSPAVSGKSTRVDHYLSAWESGSGSIDTRLHADDYTLMSFGLPGVAGWPGVAYAQGAPQDQQNYPSGITDTDGSVVDPASNKLFLSDQTWQNCTTLGDCSGGILMRSQYVRYHFYGVYPGDSQQPVAERTVFEDGEDPAYPCNGSAPCYQQSDVSDFDQVGHFRDNVMTSNFPSTSAGGGTTPTGSASHTDYKTWSQSDFYNISTKWILSNYKEVSKTVGANTVKTDYCIDPNTGFLLRKRTLAEPSRGVHDLIEQYLYTNANVTDVKSYGGDDQTLDTVQSDLCSTSLPSAPQYWDQYQYAHGLLASVQPMNPASATPLPFFSSHYTVDQSGLVTASAGTDGLTTNYSYQLWGTLAGIAPPGETASGYSYIPATATTNARVEMSRPDVTETYEYDRLGRLIRTQRSLPGASCVEQILSYDEMGRKATESVEKTCNAGGGVTAYFYDGLGRVTSVVMPDGETTSTTYRGARSIARTVSIAGPDGEAPVTTVEERDVLGRLVRVTTPQLEGLYAYDADDQLTNVTLRTDPLSPAQTRSFAYDHRGFLLSETEPELGSSGNGTTSYQHLNGSGQVDLGYDARGHVRRRVTGSVGGAFDLTYEYDPAERPLDVKNAQGGLLEQFVYDSYGPCTAPLCGGKLAAAARWNDGGDLGTIAVTQTMQYDSATGRPARRDSSVGGSASFDGLTSFFIQHWSPLGQIASITYPCQTSDSVNCSDSTRTIRYGYTNNQLTTMDDGAGSSPSSWSPLLTGVTYYPNGMTATVTHGSSSAAVTERWGADPFGMPRPSLIRATNASNVELWSTGAYAYDGAGNIKQIGGVSYSYDGSSRLTSAATTTGTSAGTSTSWQYDPFGNRLAISTRNCLSSGSVAHCSSSSTQPLTITGTTNHIASATYDAAGNVLVDETGRSFAYDSLGMMKSASLPDGGSFRYLYSPDNERIAIVQRTLGGDSQLHNRTTWELRGFDNHLLRSYVDDEAHGPRTITRNEDEIFRGALLLATDSPTAGLRHTTLDHLGSPRLLTDAAGTTIGTQTFDPFGTGGATGSGMLAFTGHERDAYNAAPAIYALPDYMHARYYSAGDGRFLAMDPELLASKALYVPQRWNRYAYAVSNPIVNIDPDGRDDNEIELLWNRFKHVFNNHIDKVDRPTRSKFASNDPEEVKGLIKDTVKKENFVRQQKNGRNVYSKEFEEPVGTAGETTVEVATAPTGTGAETVVTARPAFLEGAGTVLGVVGFIEPALKIIPYFKSFQKQYGRTPTFGETMNFLTTGDARSAQKVDRDRMGPI